MKKITKSLVVMAAINFIPFSLSAVEVGDIEAFNEEYERFSVAHPGAVAQADGIRSHVQYYEDALNPEEREASIRLHGLNNFWGAKLTFTEDALNGWIRDNQYKNHPTVAENGQALFDFSTQHRPVVTRVRELIRGSQKLQGEMYGQIGTAETYLPFLTRIRLSMIIINHALPLIQALPPFDQPEVEEAAAGPSVPSPLELHLESGNFSLAVLNMARDLYQREVNPLNALDGNQHQLVVAAIIEAVELPEDLAGERNSEDLEAKVQSLIEDNFGL